MTSIAYTYRYPFASDVSDQLSGSLVETATMDANGTHPFLFADACCTLPSLQVVCRYLAASCEPHFYLQVTAAMLDPVVTVAEDAIRLEGFSGCCGVYARADFPGCSFDGKLLAKGTTNIDFGSRMQSALARINASDAVDLSIGREDFQLHTSDETVIERKVKMPIRWIKSFTEVQTLLPRLEPRLECDGQHAIKLLKSFPKGKPPKNALYLVQQGSGIRLTTREKPGGVAVRGIHRFAVLEKLLKSVRKLRIYFDEQTGNAGWELSLMAGRFFLLVSPHVYRGFSGEGANLSRLATDGWDFSHQGYDLAEQKFFNRALPLDLTGVTKLQPRLKAARKLLQAGQVRLKTELPNREFDCLVEGTGTEHYVRLRNSNDACSCRWHSRYQGERGLASISLPLACWWTRSIRNE